MLSAWTCQKGYQCDESCHMGREILLYIKKTQCAVLSINLLTSVWDGPLIELALGLASVAPRQQVACPVRGRIPNYIKYMLYN